MPDERITLADIARLAEVKLPAVSNWRRRHQQTFPRSELRGSQEVFVEKEVTAWLDGRKIARSDLKTGEPHGITYGERFRNNLRIPQTALPGTADTWWRLLDKARGLLDVTQYADVMLGLLYLRVRYPPRWTELKDGDPRRLPESLEQLGRTLEPLLSDFQRAVSAILSEKHGQERLGEIIQMLDSISPHPGEDGDLAQPDWAGPLFEQFLDRFADLGWKHGPAVFTPASVVRVLVELTAPGLDASVLDPCCDSGQLLVGAGRYVIEHGGRPQDISLAGEALDERSWLLARMNLELHGLSADLGARPGMAVVESQHHGRQFDVVMANPPFNTRGWGQPDPADPRWRYGIPPRSNANFAWLQHILSSLAEGGTAAVIMPNAASFTASDRRIRAAMVDAGVVQSVIALPSRLFASTAVQVNVWILQHPPRTTREILFIDARSLGNATGRTQVNLLPTDAQRIAEKWMEWSPHARNGRFQGEPGFATSVPVSEIQENDYILLPGRYVGLADKTHADGRKVPELLRELDRLRTRSAEVDAIVARQMQKIESWNH